MQIVRPCVSREDFLRWNCLKHMLVRSPFPMIDFVNRFNHRQTLFLIDRCQTILRSSDEQGKKWSQVLKVGIVVIDYWHRDSRRVFSKIDVRENDVIVVLTWRELWSIRMNYSYVRHDVTVLLLIDQKQFHIRTFSYFLVKIFTCAFVFLKEVNRPKLLQSGWILFFFVYRHENDFY